MLRLCNVSCPLANPLSQRGKHVLTAQEADRQQKVHNLLADDDWLAPKEPQIRVGAVIVDYVVEFIFNHSSSRPLTYSTLSKQAAPIHHQAIDSAHRSHRCTHLEITTTSFSHLFTRIYWREGFFHTANERRSKLLSESHCLPIALASLASQNFT